MSFFKSLVFAFALILSAPTAQAQDVGIPVDSEFMEFDIRFTGELGVVYTGLWDARIINNQIAICGVGHLRSPRLRSTVRQMARDGQLEINGQTYAFDLTYFPRVQSEGALRSAQATCRSTGVRPSGRWSVRMEFGRGTFRN
jgi:hypothetical protein